MAGGKQRTKQGLAADTDSSPQRLRTLINPTREFNKNFRERVQRFSSLSFLKHGLQSVIWSSFNCLSCLGLLNVSMTSSGQPHPTQRNSTIPAFRIDKQRYGEAPQLNGRKSEFSCPNNTIIYPGRYSSTAAMPASKSLNGVVPPRVECRRQEDLRSFRP